MMDASQTPFSRRTVALLVILGVLLALGWLLMSGFGGELQRRQERTIGPQAAEATGFRALYNILDRAGARPAIISARDHLARPGLLILMPDADTRADDIDAIITLREDNEGAEGATATPTLIVMPKWQVERIVPGIARVRRLSPLPGLMSGRLLAALGGGSMIQAPDGDVTLRNAPGLLPFRVPQDMQALRSPAIVPFITARDGSVVFGQVRDTETFIVADPDLLNNWGMRHRENAVAAAALIAFARYDKGLPILFDETLQLRPGDRNLIRLMFEPPFLGVTIALIAAAILAGIGSFNRFGPPLVERRAIALGKAALIDNIVALMRAAGRTPRAGPAYADAMREQLARRLRGPRAATDADLAEALDRLRPANPWSAIDAQLRAARNEAELVRAAKALDEWRKDVKA